MTQIGYRSNDSFDTLKSRRLENEVKERADGDAKCFREAKVSLSAVIRFAVQASVLKLLFLL